MAVPVNVTASIAALQALPPVEPAGRAIEVAYEVIRGRMLATGTYPTDSAEIIRQALIATVVTVIEPQIRADLLGTFQRIQAAG